MRILFLDIDGVLNDPEFLLASLNDGTWEENVDRRRVARVNRIVDETGARIVVCSDWRHLLPLRRLQEVLADRGLKSRIFGRTPAIRDADRGLECAAWIGCFKQQVTSFAVVDDRWDFRPIRHRHVRTSAQLGLTQSDAERAIRLLRGTSLGTVHRCRAKASQWRSRTVRIRPPADLHVSEADAVLDRVYRTVYAGLVTARM